MTGNAISNDVRFSAIVVALAALWLAMLNFGGGSATQISSRPLGPVLNGPVPKTLFCLASAIFFRAIFCTSDPVTVR